MLQKMRARKINALAPNDSFVWSTFGQPRHDSGQLMSKKRHFFPEALGRNNPEDGRFCGYLHSARIAPKALRQGGSTMSSDNENSKDGSFTVVDKRRFDTSGHQRTEPTSPSQSQPESATQFTHRDAPSTSDEEPVAFNSFIMSLATQALVQMGEMPAPNGMDIPLDMESARQTIDILAMLQRRTRGNLAPEESRFLEEVLHSLRVSFINKKTR